VPHESGTLTGAEEEEEEDEEAIVKKLRRLFTEKEGVEAGSAWTRLWRNTAVDGSRSADIRKKSASGGGFAASENTIFNFIWKTRSGRAAGGRG